MSSSSLPVHACQSIVRVFNVHDVEPEAGMTLDEVRAFLIPRIASLLERNLDLLFSALYRIDVPEPAVKQAFATAGHDELPAVLVDLIIERQIQKIHTRRAYKDSNS